MYQLPGSDGSDSTSTAVNAESVDLVSWNRYGTRSQARRARSQFISTAWKNKNPIIYFNITIRIRLDEVVEVAEGVMYL